MADRIHTILNELYQDHRNVSMLLDLLEREACCLIDAKQADTELVHDIMRYMTVYPDAVHHPKEDRLYAELKAVRPELAAGFSRIALDHAALAQMGKNLLRNVSALRAGQDLAVEPLANDVLNYVNSLRSHMQWEELDLFRRCRRMADDGHAVLSFATRFGDDPLFGHDVESTYSRLFSRIRATGLERLSG